MALQARVQRRQESDRGIDEDLPQDLAVGESFQGSTQLAQANDTIDQFRTQAPVFKDSQSFIQVLIADVGERGVEGDFLEDHAVYVDDLLPRWDADGQNAAATTDEAKGFTELSVGATGFDHHIRWTAQGVLD